MNPILIFIMYTHKLTKRVWHLQKAAILRVNIFNPFC